MPAQRCIAKRVPIEDGSTLRGRAIALHLLRRHSNLAPATPEPSYKLASGRLRRVLDYMHAHLKEDLSLAELAGLSGLGPSQFARGFRETTGRAPHRGAASCSRAPPGFRVRTGFDSGRGRFWSPERHRRGRCGKRAVLFLSANTARHPVGICVGIGSKTRRSLLSIQMVMGPGDCRPGAPRFAFQASLGAAIEQMAKPVRPASFDRRVSAGRRKQ